MYFVKSELMDKAAVRRSLARITHEIIERSKGTENVCIIGVKSRGVYLADILAENIRKFENVSVPVGYIDITSFRDDRSHDGESLVRNTVDFDLNGMKVVLVDDVICTGRTARAAIEAIFALGRPSSIQLAVLVDRGHRELPIHPDFVGKNIPTSKDEFVSVLLDEHDGCTSVRIMGKSNE